MAALLSRSSLLGFPDGGVRTCLLSVPGRFSQFSGRNRTDTFSGVLDREAAARRPNLTGRVRRPRANSGAGLAVGHQSPDQFVFAGISHRYERRRRSAAFVHRIFFLRPAALWRDIPLVFAYEFVIQTRLQIAVLFAFAQLRVRNRANTGLRRTSKRTGRAVPFERDCAFSCPAVVFHTWIAAFRSFSRERGEEGHERE